MAAPAHELSNEHSVDLDPRIEIVGWHEGLAIAIVPIECINETDTPVDKEHVDELITEMRDHAQTSGGTGQKMPVELGQIADGRRGLELVDGFHRTRAIKQAGGQSVYAYIQLGMTPDQLCSQRIIAATKHRTVKFARVTGWMDENWQLTPWAAHMTARQAFTLGSKDGASSSLSPDQLSQVRTWVDSRSKEWDMAGSTIARYLQIAEEVDPRISNSLRGDRDDSLTLEKLQIIGSHFPSNWAMQDLGVSCVRGANLSLSQTRVLCARLKKCKDTAAAIEAVEQMDLTALREKTPPRKSSSPKQPKSRGHLSVVADLPAAPIMPKVETTTVSDLREIIVQDEVELALAALRVAILFEAYRAPSQNRHASSLEQLPVSPAASLMISAAQVNGVASLEAMELFASQENVVALRQNIAKRYEGTNLSSEVIPRFVNQGLRQVADDAREGGIQYVRLTRPDQIGRLAFNTTSGLVRDMLRDQAQPPLNRVAPRVSFLPGRQLSEVLPGLERVDRRIVTMAAGLNLSSFVIAEVLNEDSAKIRGRLAAIAKDRLLPTAG